MAAVLTADPKPAPRVVDRGASMRKLLKDPSCRACGERAANCHHLVGKAQGGDDVEDNLIPLCGSGSHGCHGALHGNPYYRSGRRWEAQDVRRAIGLRLRPSEYTYALEKLSRPEDASVVGRVWPSYVEHRNYDPGREFLRDQYYVEVETLMPFVMREWSPF